MRKITLIGVMLVCCISFAQVPNWVWGHNYESFNQESRSLTASDSDGNVYLIGNFQSATVSIGTNTFTNAGTDSNTGDVYLVKFDSDGNMLWAKKAGGPEFDSIASVATDNDGNVYVVGSFNSQITFGTTTLTHDTIGNFLVKYDSDGNVVWAKSCSGTADFYVGYRIKLDASNNIYMTGYFTSQTLTFGSITLINDNFTPGGGNGTPFVAKFDPAGNPVWAKNAQRTGTSGFINISSDISVDGSGNVFIGGYYFTDTIQFGSTIITNPNPGQPFPNVFMAKYDPSGNVSWARTVTPGPFQNNYITCVNADNSGNVYFSGSFNSTMTIDSTTLMASGSGNKAFVLKLDSSGNVLWGKTASNNGYGGIDGADTDAGGNLYVGGTFNGTSINFGSGNVNVADSSGNMFVVKYNAANGSVGWVRLGGPTNINNRTSIDCKNQNDIFVGAYFFNNLITLGSVVLQKTPTAGYNIFLAKLQYTPLANEEFAGTVFSMYPNPVSDVANIGNLQGQNAYVLYDYSGKQIASGVWENENETLQTGNLASGIYLLKVQNENGGTATKKLVKK